MCQSFSCASNDAIAHATRNVSFSHLQVFQVREPLEYTVRQGGKFVVVQVTGKDTSEADSVLAN